MARLMSQAKGQYYPAAPEAVAAVLERLWAPVRGECMVCDPCAGDGMALLQLASGLDAVAYGVELSEDRAEILKTLLGDDTLAPADFLRCQVSPHSFSMIWCNPPYDYATGEGCRVEDQFLQRSVSLLAPDGVLAFVCPEGVAKAYDTVSFFEERFCRISAMPFPAEVRRYNETIILGKKRREPSTEYVRHYGWLDRKLEEEVQYVLPPGQRPRVFRVTEPTDTELVRMVAQSPLRFMLSPMTDKADVRPRPPMSIGTGHRALLLAAGHIDGLICPPDEPPHVIRGSATKEKYIAQQDVTEDEKGNCTTKTVFSEKPKLLIRVLDSRGNITTLE